MSEIGELFEGWKEHGQQKRAANRDNSQALLAGAGIDFTSNNNGVHLVVVDHGNTFDFWPGTGKWTRRGSNHYARGVRPLLKAIKKARGPDADFGQFKAPPKVRPQEREDLDPEAYEEIERQLDKDE